MSKFYRKPVPHGIARICGQCKEFLTMENCNNDTIQVGNEVLVVCRDCWLNKEKCCALCKVHLTGNEKVWYLNVANENRRVCNDCYLTSHHPDAAFSGNQLPSGQGKRDKICHRHDLIPVEFLDEIASIFEEGLRPRPGLPEGYGDSWKAGGDDFLRDCLNHASNHLHRAMNGDKSENNLAKVAWGCLVVRWHELKKEEEK